MSENYGERELRNASQSSGRCESVRSASPILGVSVFTIRRLIKAGEIRAVHVGARVLVPAAEIERVANHGVGVARVGKPRTSAKVR